MGVKKKRRVFGLFYVFLWGIAFGLGVSVVYLFLYGFSFFDERVLQRGYALFSSSSPLYIDGKYIEGSGKNELFEAGNHTLCVEEFFKNTRCFNAVGVFENSEESQVFSSLFTLVEEKEAIGSVLSDDVDTVVFSSVDKAILWYSPRLQQVFYVTEESGEVQSLFLGSSLFPLDSVKSIAYEEDTHRFVLYGDDKKNPFYINVSVSSERSVFLGFVEKKMDYLFDSYFFSVVSFIDTFSFQESVDVRGVFLQKNMASYFIDDQKTVLFFEDSVYLFSEKREVFHFLSRKDSDFDGFCSAEKKRCVFKKDGKVYQIFL